MIKKLFNINSILGRLMVSYLIVIFLSLAVIGIMFGYLVQNYYYGLKEWEATNNSRRIASLVSENIGEANILLTDDFSIDSTRAKIITIARSTNMDIGLIDRNGEMVLNVPSIEANLSLEKQELDHVLSGNAFTKKIMGPDYRHLLMAIPLIKTGDNDIKIVSNQLKEDKNNVVGAVLIQTPLGNIGATINNIMKLILYSFLVALAAAIFLSISFSRKITHPIDKIKEAALKSTEGNVQKVELPENSTEEINHLANTYNYAAKQINKTLEKQRSLENMQKQFVADVSHEFRAPLTSIKGFLEILLEQDLSKEERQEYLNIMYKDSQHLEKLLNDLLELSKLDTTNDSLDKKSTAPKILYDKALKSLAGIIENKNIEIEKKIEPDLPEIDIDRNKMHQVLINLIENAVNYSPANSQITLKAEKATENNFKVKFSIIDNGIGIPEEELDNIWERFYKIDSARSRDNHKGSGLGLAIVKDIIKKHAGKIKVESKVNEGSKFIFKI
ncbi:MAG TPA: HAMP domain-containing sensor histidine kinase [Halanaerobiales bacterium]|nr:HAMP domain-containing sensor histidine kinase [Halanaerobiales bacterium]